MNKNVVEVSGKRKPRSSPAHLIGSNADLLFEILLLLPAKSLFKFKLVSRQWNLIISDKCFFNRWLLRREHSFIVRYQYGQKSEFFHGGSDGFLGTSEFFICDPTVNKFSRFKFPFDFPYIEVLQSTHGLLFVHCRNWEMNHYYVFNPTTMESRLIHSNTKKCPKFTTYLYLIFDPRISENYKVVSFSRARLGRVGERIHFSVYNSGTHTWTEDGSSDMLHRGFKFRGGVNHDGGVYFVQEDGSSLFYSPQKKQLRRVPCPPKRKGRFVTKLFVSSRNKYFVVQSNGHLHCLQIHFKEKKKKYHGKVLEMVEGEWVWCRQLKLKLGIVEEVELVGMIRQERIEHSVFVFQLAGGRIMKFGFGDERGEVVVERGLDLSKCRGEVVVHGYHDVGEVFVDHGTMELCNCKGPRPPVLEDFHPFIHSCVSV